MSGLLDGLLGAGTGVVLLGDRSRELRAQDYQRMVQDICNAGPGDIIRVPTGAELLPGEFARGATPANCRNCGAPDRHRKVTCDYCGS